MTEMNEYGVGITIKKWIPVIILLSAVFIMGKSIWFAGHQPKVVSLKQAIELCLPAALRWSPDARLAYAISTESGEYAETGSQGTDGLRSNWNVIFVEETTGRNLLVAVRQGRMSYTRELLMAFKQPIDLSGLRIDSTAAIQRLTDKNQPPNKVHYELVGQQSLVLRVYQDYSNVNLRITSIDGATGEVISQWYSAVN
ncbi:MAG: hypothetical protein ACM3UW_04990 [Bacillota bacterium]